MLTLVGLGYNVAGHATPEAESSMRYAGRLFYLVTDPATAAWARGLNPAASSLHDCYREGERGSDASHAMVARILEPLQAGLRVCVAFSGHPAIAMHTAHEARRRAAALGFPVRILPGVSFEDCLVAALGVDPGRTGRALHDATDFVLRPRAVDTGAALVLVQIGVIGESTYRASATASPEGLRLLQEVLERHYPAEHEVVLFEMPQLPVAEPKVVRLPLGRIAGGPVGVSTTLYVPPLNDPVLDTAVLARLGLETGEALPR